MPWDVMSSILSAKAYLDEEAYYKQVEDGESEVEELPGPGHPVLDLHVLAEDLPIELEDKGDEVSSLPALQPGPGQLEGGGHEEGRQEGGQVQQPRQGGQDRHHVEDWADGLGLPGQDDPLVGADGGGVVDRPVPGQVVWGVCPGRAALPGVGDVDVGQADVGLPVQHVAYHTVPPWQT